MSFLEQRESGLAWRYNFIDYFHMRQNRSRPRFFLYSKTDREGADRKIHSVSPEPVNGFPVPHSIDLKSTTTSSTCHFSVSSLITPPFASVEIFASLQDSPATRHVFCHKTLPDDLIDFIPGNLRLYSVYHISVACSYLIPERRRHSDLSLSFRCRQLCVSLAAK